MTKIQVYAVIAAIFATTIILTLTSSIFTSPQLAINNS
jgi:uncharacterized membrane protein